MDEDATWYGSRPRRRPHCIRRVPSAPRKGRSTPPPLLGPCLLWPRSHISATAELLLQIVEHVTGSRSNIVSFRLLPYQPIVVSLIRDTITIMSVSLHLRSLRPLLYSLRPFLLCSLNPARCSLDHWTAMTTVNFHGWSTQSVKHALTSEVAWQIDSLSASLTLKK